MRRHLIMLVTGTLLATACGGATPAQEAEPDVAAQLPKDDDATALLEPSGSAPAGDAGQQDDFLTASESAAEAQARAGGDGTASDDFSAIAGTWEGPSTDDRDRPSFIVNADFDRRPDDRGVIGEATWFYGDGTATCEVDLRVNRASEPTYIVEEFVTADYTERDACMNGYVRLTLTEDGTLRYTFGPRRERPITLELSRSDA